MKTIEQELAKKVYDRVEAFAQAHPDKDSPARKKYGGLAHKLPILVRTAGLAEAPDKGDPMINHKRHKRLLKLLDEREHASVQQLMEWLSASAATVRRNDATARSSDSRSLRSATTMKAVTSPWRPR